MQRKCSCREGKEVGAVATPVAVHNLALTAGTRCRPGAGCPGGGTGAGTRAAVRLGLVLSLDLEPERAPSWYQSSVQLESWGWCSGVGLSSVPEPVEGIGWS